MRSVSHGGGRSMVDVVAFVDRYKDVLSIAGGAISAVASASWALYLFAKQRSASGQPTLLPTAADAPAPIPAANPPTPLAAIFFRAVSGGLIGVVIAPFMLVFSGGIVVVLIIAAMLAVFGAPLLGFSFSSTVSFLVALGSFGTVCGIAANHAASSARDGAVSNDAQNGLIGLIVGGLVGAGILELLSMRWGHPSLAVAMIGAVAGGVFGIGGVMAYDVK